MTFLYCLWHKEEGCGIGHQSVISDLGNLNNTLGASAACKCHSTQRNKQLTISLAWLETEGGLTAGGRGRTAGSRGRINCRWQREDCRAGRGRTNCRWQREDRRRQREDCRAGRTWASRKLLSYQGSQGHRLIWAQWPNPQQSLPNPGCHLCWVEFPMWELTGRGRK